MRSVTASATSSSVARRKASRTWLFSGSQPAASKMQSKTRGER